MKMHKKVIALLLALAMSTETVPVITNPITVEAASSVRLSKTKLTMGLGDSYTIKLKGVKKPVWKSSNKRIAIVKNGKVIAKKTGKVTITATYKGKSYKCSVLVKSPKISSAKFTLRVGTKKQLRIFNTINKVTWVSSKKSVAVVNKKGLVTARKAGKATIVAKLHGKKYKALVTVKKNVAKPVALSKKSAKLFVGSSLQLKLNNAVSSKVSWKSSNKAVATVSKGKVTPKKSGSITITATYNKKTYKCKLVIPKPAITSKNGFTVNVGNSLQFSTTNTKGKVAWASSDTSIATIDSTGKLLAKDEGTVVISAKVGSCTIKKTVEVTLDSVYNEYNISTNQGKVHHVEKGTIVEDKTNGLVSIKGTTLKMLKPGFAELVIKADNGDIHDYKFSIATPYISENELTLKAGETQIIYLFNNAMSTAWTSSNPSIATVDSDGFITGKKKGKATITALVNGVKYTCKVTVVGGSSSSTGSTGSTGGSTGSSSSSTGSTGGSTGSSTGSTGNTGSTGGSSSTGTTGGTGNTGGSTGSTGSTGSSGSTGSAGSTYNPSTSAPDPKAEITRIDWNNKDYIERDLGQLIHGNKKQLIIDNAPADLTISLDPEWDDVINIDKNGVITTKGDISRKGDEHKVGIARIVLKSGDEEDNFWVEVVRASFTEPDKNKKRYEMFLTEYYNQLSAYEYNPEIPEEARRDIFNYLVGNNYSKVNAKFEFMYGECSPYLDFGDYYVYFGMCEVTDPVESADRMDAVFGWLKDKPDYVKVREVGRWMQSRIRYGDYTSDGTFLGIKTGVCSNTAVFLSTVLWYLGVRCHHISSNKRDHAWNTVQLDGYWYAVEMTAGSAVLEDDYLSSTFYQMVGQKDYTEIFEPSGYAAAHPFGTKYLDGCKVFTYNSMDELKADYNDKSSKFWNEFNSYGSVAVNLPYTYTIEVQNLLPGFGRWGTIQNSLKDVVDLNDRSRMTVTCYSQSLLSENEYLPPLSDYLN